MRNKILVTFFVRVDLDMVLLTAKELPVVLKLDLYSSFFMGVGGGGVRAQKTVTRPGVFLSLPAQNIHKRTHQYKLNFALFFDNLIERIR